MYLVSDIDFALVQKSSNTTLCRGSLPLFGAAIDNLAKATVNSGRRFPKMRLSRNKSACYAIILILSMHLSKSKVDSR